MIHHFSPSVTIFHHGRQFCQYPKNRFLFVRDRDLIIHLYARIGQRQRCRRERNNATFLCLGKEQGARNYVLFKSRTSQVGMIDWVAYFPSFAGPNISAIAKTKNVPSVLSNSILAMPIPENPIEVDWKLAPDAPRSEVTTDMPEAAFSLIKETFEAAQSFNN